MSPKTATSLNRFIAFCLIVLSIVGCTSGRYCSEDDFLMMDKIDVHCHVNSTLPVFMEQARNDNFRILTINTDAPLDFDILQQQDNALVQAELFPRWINYLTTFSMDGWGRAGWLEKSKAYIDESIKRGALGVKVWKNIGMVVKDQDSVFVMIDNPGFDPLFDYFEEKGIPVCGHLGEPRNCWLPIEEMTVNSDKKYFARHPQYHMFLHPEFPSYEEQIRARDHMLEKHPDLRFMGAHLASLEWNLDVLADFMDKFPKTTVDLAARMCHLQWHAQADREKVREFMIRYQDRIIYGTDMGDLLGGWQEPEKLTKNTHQTWLRDWKFLTTDDTMHVDQLDGEFKGLKLPRKVIKKIYRTNAGKMFPGL